MTIVKFTGTTCNDIDPDNVLSEAVGALESAVVIGRDKEGELYFASSLGSTAETLLLVELFKNFLINTDEE